MAQKNAVALGLFDGVHIGHGALLRAAAEAAKSAGVTPVALTFDTHPEQFVSGKAPALLSTPEERRELMRRFYGIEQVVTLHFDEALRNTPWQTFAKDVLLDRLHAEILICGEDFRFGYRGEGTAALLFDFCRERGVRCQIIPQVCVDGVPVSSTRIRALIGEGNWAQALRLLGHPHLICGKVTHGRHLGGRLGFPTANMPLNDGRLPLPYGVYAATVLIGGREYLSVTNIGVHPTVGALSAPVAESWLPDYQGDLYDQKILLFLHDFVRPERQFSDVEELKRQIALDEVAIRAFFDKK